MPLYEFDASVTAAMGFKETVPGPVSPILPPPAGWKKER